MPGRGPATRAQVGASECKLADRVRHHWLLPLTRGPLPA